MSVEGHNVAADRLDGPELPEFLADRLRRFPVEAVSDDIDRIVAVDVEAALISRLLEAHGVPDVKRRELTRAYIEGLYQRLSRTGRWERPPDFLISVVDVPARRWIPPWLHRAWQDLRQILGHVTTWIDNRRMTLRRWRWHRRLANFHTGPTTTPGR